MTFENLNLEKQWKGEKISQKEASEELSQLNNTRKVLANITQTWNPELSKKLKNTNIQNDVLKFIELSVNNKLASHLSEFNVSKFDKDGEMWLDKFEFWNFKKALEVSIKQIIILDWLQAFSQIHHDSAKISPDKWLAEKVDIQKHILGDKDSKTFTKQWLEKLGLNLTEEYYHKMEEKKFNPTDGKSWQELWILVGKEVGEWLESILRFFWNVPSWIVLLPRYLTYRERYIAYSMNKDIQKANEIEIKKNELVEQNISLALLEILGEKGIDMLKKLWEMVVSWKQWDIAMLLVTIAWILAWWAGLIKMWTRFTRRLAIKNARKVSRLWQNPILWQKGRGILREVEKNAWKAEHTLWIVDNIVSTGGLAGVWHIVTKGIAPEWVLRENARLSKKERIFKAEELLQRKLTPENKEALLKAHNYKQWYNIAKWKALMKWGFTREEAKFLMDQWVAWVFDRFWWNRINLSQRIVKIEDVKNFDDLEKYLQKLPLAWIQWSSKFYTSQELIEIVGKIRNWKLDINYITSSWWIRQKVIELLSNEKKGNLLGLNNGIKIWREYSKINVVDLPEWKVLQVKTANGSIYNFTIIRNQNWKVLVKWSWGKETLRGVEWEILGNTIEEWKPLLIDGWNTSNISKIRILDAENIPQRLMNPIDINWYDIKTDYHLVRNPSSPQNPKFHDYKVSYIEAGRYFERLLASKYQINLSEFIQVCNEMHIKMAQKYVWKWWMDIRPWVIRWGDGNISSNRQAAYQYVRDLWYEVSENIKISWLTESGIYNIWAKHNYPEWLIIWNYYEAWLKHLNFFLKTKNIDYLSDYYHTMINARPYWQVNQSLFLNQVNILLWRIWHPPVKHGYIDHIAHRVNYLDFRKIFKKHINNNLPLPKDTHGF